MTKFTDKVIDTFVLPVMNLKISVGGETKTFTSPVAETILYQVREINRTSTVGNAQVEYFDTADNKFKSFTYCCGDKYEFNFTTKQFRALETEKDCYGFPVTYDGSVPGELARYKQIVGAGNKEYKDHIADVRAKQFGTTPAVAPGTDRRTKPVGT